MEPGVVTVLPPLLPRTRLQFPAIPTSRSDQEDTSNIYSFVQPGINKNLLNSAIGNLSTWPAYGAGQTITQKHKPCSESDTRGTRSGKENVTVSKPRYLEKLESYLRRELQSLDSAKVISQELRLQPYRDVFDYFMEDFKTYKPLLCAIKNEYEVTLAHQRERIRSLEPLKAMLVSVSERCDKKIQEIYEKERLEVKTLQMEKLSLLQVIDKLKEEKISLQAQVSKLQEEIEKTYLMYRNECDARKLLISDINELKHQQEDLKLSQDPKVQGEDPVTLAVALRMARSDLTKTQVLLNTLKADYGDVVPRRDFENQEKNLAACVEKIETLQKDFAQLQREHKSLLEINQEVVQQRDSFCREVDDLQRSLSPRPLWEKCVDILPEVFQRWSESSEGKSSDQLVDVLLTELGRKILKEKDFFPGMGTGNNVPIHLRHEGPVRNLKLKIKEVYSLIKEIWKEKFALDLQKGRQSSLSEFMINHLQKKFGEASFEWSYTLHQTCRIHLINEQIHSFYKVLMGQMDEDLYYALFHVRTNLLKELTATDSSNVGSLTQEQFRFQLRKAFPSKSSDDIQELLDAADSQLKPEDENLHYKSLFSEDEEGNPSHFIAILRNQFSAERKQYLKELRNKLRNSNVKPEELKAAFLSVDPAIDDKTLDKYLTRAFQLTKDQLEVTKPLPLKQLFHNLEAVNLRKTGPVAQV
ncbi:translin-associated factor X-interacting protein 1 isoform X1 [Hyla sarda]|uniref:translin-associated factor X-interacting protein 1 isoform X1 n=1 Tax=Hyla sarda TaxID=327740 RepID=UPI0024C389BA|nr:translin-associated factor X-interacting protein 1 isoform X1 [Hyla sarda]